MTTYREETVTRTDAVPPYSEATTSQVTYRSSPTALIERVIVFVFGIIQGLIVLRVVLLLVSARQGNDLVAFIYSISDVFVAPFRGMLQFNELSSGQAQLDVAGLVALIGWTILELVVLALIRVFRPSTTA